MKDPLEKIYDWQYRNTGSFFNMLITLFQKADPENKARLAMGFPEEYAAYCAWYHSSDPDALFRARGFRLPGDPTPPTEDRKP